MKGFISVSSVDVVALSVVEEFVRVSVGKCRIEYGLGLGLWVTR